MSSQLIFPFQNFISYQSLQSYYFPASVHKLNMFNLLKFLCLVFIHWLSISFLFFHILPFIEILNCEYNPQKWKLFWFCTKLEQRNWRQHSWRWWSRIIDVLWVQRCVRRLCLLIQPCLISGTLVWSLILFFFSKRKINVDSSLASLGHITFLYFEPHSLWNLYNLIIVSYLFLFIYNHRCYLLIAFYLASWYNRSWHYYILF